MMMQLFTHRHTAWTIAERRLCHLPTGNPSVAPSSPEPNLVQRATGFAAEWAKWGLEKTVNGAVGIKDGIVDAWNKNSDAEESKNAQLRSTGEFLSVAPPLVISLVEDAFNKCRAKGESPSLADIANLTDLSKWVEAFKDKDVFTPPMNKKNVTLLEGPLGLINSQDESQRTLLYHDFVCKLIPGAVQAQYHHIFLPPTATRPLAGANMIEWRDTINNAMSTMLGAESTDAQALDLAKNALLHRYFVDGQQDPTVGGTGGLKMPAINKGLIREKSPTGNVDELKAIAGSSLLKGAANLKVIRPEDLYNAQEYRRNMHQDELAKGNDTVIKLAKMAGITKKEIESAAKGLDQIWDDMPGYQKGLTVLAGVATLFIMLRSKLGQATIAGGTVLFLGGKFLLDTNIFTPLGKIAKGMAKKSKNIISNPLAKMAGVTDVAPVDLATLEHRDTLVGNYISEGLHEDLNSAKEALTVLYDMPMSQILPYLELPDGKSYLPGQRGRLKVWDPQFQKAIRTCLEERGMKGSLASKVFGKAGDIDQRKTAIDTRIAARGGMATREEQFERDAIARQSTLATELGATLSTICMAKGSKPGDPRIDHVEAARLNTRTGSYDDIPPVDVPVGAGVIVNPQREYMELRQEGKREFMKSRETLGAFFESETHIAAAPDEQKDKVEQGRIEQKKTDLAKYEHMGRNAGLRAVRDGDYIIIDVPTGGVLGVGATPTFQYKMEIQKFLDSSPQEIGREWAKKALPEKMKRVQPFAKLKYVGKDLWIKADEEVIKYSKNDPSFPSLIPGAPSAYVGESSMYEFMVTEDRAIIDKYDEWQDTKVQLIVTLKETDPLRYKK